MNKVTEVINEVKEKGLTKVLKQFIGFGLVGALNTFLGLGIYWVAVHLGAHYFVANAIGFVITVAVSYVLNNLFTFRDGEKAVWSFKILLKVYASYSVTGLFLNSILLWLWVDMIGLNENIAPVLNMVFTIPINFFLNKVWAYNK